MGEVTAEVAWADRDIYAAMVWVDLADDLEDLIEAVSEPTGIESATTAGAGHLLLEEEGGMGFKIDIPSVPKTLFAVRVLFPCLTSFPLRCSGCFRGARGSC